MALLPKTTPSVKILYKGILLERLAMHLPLQGEFCRAH